MGEKKDNDSQRLSLCWQRMIWKCTWMNKDHLTNVTMVWDVAESVSSIYTARCTTPRLPKGVLTQQTWGATDLVSAKHKWKWGASPYNSKGHYGPGQVVLAQALRKGNTSSYSEWISALELKLTEINCASFLTSLLEWSKILQHLWQFCSIT